MIIGKVQNILVFMALALILMSGCSKNGDTSLPETAIIMPGANSTYYVPGNLECRFTVRSVTPLKTVKVNITNESFVPVFGDIIFKPLKKEIDTGFTFHLEMKNVDPATTFYFHVSAENSAGIKNKYGPITLVNKKPVLTDMLYVRKNGNGTEVVNNHNNVVLTLNGTFKEMAFNPGTQSLFLVTNRPAALKNLNYPGMNEIWAYLPQNSVEFSGLFYDEENRILYTPGSDGSVYGFNSMNGNIIFSTPFMQDTVPSAIIATTDYLFGEYYTLHNGHILWLTFYKESGMPVFKRESGTLSQFILPYKGNTVAIVRETEKGSLVLFYDTEKQEVTATQQITGQTVTTACSGPDNHLFLATDSQLIFADEFTVRKADGCIFNKPLSLKYFDFDNNLYILEKGRLTVLKWPECTTVTINNVDGQITEFQPVYSYEQ